MLRYTLLIAVSLVVSVPLGAKTIISTDGQGNNGYGLLVFYNFEAAWSQTGTFTNVTITAEIDPGTGPGTFGTAYLMTQIGAGTTVADQIATAPFTATGSAFTPVLNTLFTGLTLGPGDYYLVLTAANGLGWEVTNGTAPVTAPGVNLISNADTFVTSKAAYAPASIFSSVEGPDLEFTATGTMVPEPSTMVLIAGSLALLALGHRFRSARAAIATR